MSGPVLVCLLQTKQHAGTAKATAMVDWTFLSPTFLTAMVEWAGVMVAVLAAGRNGTVKDQHDQR